MEAVQRKGGLWGSSYTALLLHPSLRILCCVQPHLLALELRHHPLQQRVVEVLSTQERVSVGGLDLSGRKKRKRGA